MAGEADSKAKICGICGTDVTSKSRVKDAQGNYFCKACIDKQQGGAKAPAPGAPKAAGKAPAPASASRDEMNVMAKLINESVSKNATSCPGCRRPMKDTAIICTNCGFNRQTSQVVQTEIKKAESSTDKSKSGKKRFGLF